MGILGSNKALKIAPENTPFGSLKNTHLVAFRVLICNTLCAMLRSLLPTLQIAVSVLLVIAVLLQPSTAGLGGAFGGTDAAQAFRTKRGFEKFLFVATIALGVIFAALCVLAIVL